MHFPDKTRLGFSSWADGTKSVRSFGEAYALFNWAYAFSLKEKSRFKIEI